MNKEQLDRAKALEYIIETVERGVKKMNTEHPVMVFKIKTEEELRKGLFDSYSDIRELNRALDDDDTKELIDFMTMCGRQFQERILKASEKSLNNFKQEFKEL